MNDVFPARIRALQGIYPEAHEALLNWGRWSRDKRGIYPSQIAPARIWDEYQPSKWTADEKDEDAEEAPQLEVKAERAEQEPYNELQGASLDERINSRMLACEVTRALVIAYVWTIPEYQFPSRAGCLPDHFCERLETGLRFVARFC